MIIKHLVAIFLYSVMAMFLIPVVSSFVSTEALPLLFKAFFIMTLLVAYAVGVIAVKKAIYRK